MKRQLMEISIMDNYTPLERAKIVELYIKNNYSIVKTQREFRKNFGSRSAPAKNTIKRIYEKFSNTAYLGNKKRPEKPRPKRSDENIDRVRRSIEENKQTSSRRRASQLNIATTTLRRIIRQDLGLYPYRILSTHRLLLVDFAKRIEYAKMVIEMAAADDSFWHSIIMSDEAHFTLSGSVNSQNYRYYAEENPQIIHEEPLHDQKVTVWCGITAEKVIGPYFFQDVHGKAITVNGERYRAMIRDFLMPKVEENEMQGYWFQQDGATAHTSLETMNLLQQIFPNRIISKNGDFAWPPRSPDLTPPDFFLWGYLKSKVYINKPQSIRVLKTNIRREINKIPVEMLHKVMENAEKRARACIQAKGGHLRDVIFHS